MKENTKLIISIFCIAFIVRVIFFLIMPQFFDRMFRFWDDWIYLEYAKNILNQGWWVLDISKLDVNIDGRQYNADGVGPGYPLVVSLIMFLFGDDLRVIMFLNVIFSSLTCIVIYYLGKEVFYKQIGILSSFWSIIYVYFMIYMPRVLKENLLQLLIPLVILLMVYEIKKEKVNMISIFFPLAFTYLVHSDERYIIFLPIILFTMIACDNVHRINGLKKFTVFLAAVIILSIPWAVRNYVVYNRLVILTTRTEWFRENNVEIVKKPLFDRILNSKAVSGNLDNTSKMKFENKSGYFDEKLQRLSIYWAPMVLRESKLGSNVMLAGSLKYNLGGLLTYGILLPFFIVGSIFTLKKNKLGFSLIIFIIIQSLLHILIDIINPWPRYRYPIDSLIIIIAFYGFYQLLQLKIFKRLILPSSNLYSFLYVSKH